MDPAITGDEFIHQLLTVLKKINTPVSEVISPVIAQLESIVGLLDHIDEQLHQSPAVYATLVDKIKEAGVAFEENKLLQVDMYSEPATHTIPDNLRGELQKAMEALARIFPGIPNENLVSFAERFRSRYEDQLVPLLKVLDAETGIGFTEQSGRNLSPLLENIAMPAGRDRDNYDIKWNKTEQWLFQLLIASSDKYEVVLDEKSLPAVTGNTSVFPPSVSVLFSMVEGDTIVLRGCSGSSAANLLGRFAHADKNIHGLVLKIAAQEQALNTGVHFAEIVHLPEDRVGNILLHPAFREYEIPFLAQSSLPQSHQVALQDLLISVGQDKQIRLFSKRLDKEIIPRLSNAHNYSFGSLPVYHFLAELQSQGQVSGLSFNWGSMARQFRFLPRVRYNNTILFEATWQLRKEDIDPLLSQKEWSAPVIEKFRSVWNMPRMLVLADGDNELLVDLESRISVETFISTIRERDMVILKEFIFPAAVVMDEKGMAYNNQLVAVLMNNRQVYAKQPVLFTDMPAENIQRKFLPGSPWLYYKVYCGTKTADEILLRCIEPLSALLLQQGLVDKWFFIRYNDPGFHLRIRFHIPEMHHYGEVVKQFLHFLEEMNREGLITSVQTDTYQRELERYGYGLTVYAEELFFIDSKLKLEFLQLTEGDEREKLRWLWALRGVDELLNAFQLTLAEKYELMQSFQQSFAAEFNAGKQLFRQLNQQYNENRKQIQQVMEYPVAAENEFKPLLDIFSRYETELRIAAGRILSTPAINASPDILKGLMSGYIHMNLNRLFLSEPRQHELLVYDFLCSWYRSQLKRN
jgi:thiopeptide-type bacteriocin biosynthesis protein